MIRMIHPYDYIYMYFFDVEDQRDPTHRFRRDPTRVQHSSTAAR